MTFQASAAIYDRQVGRYSPQLSAALIEAAGIDRRDRVLDVGCGPGGLTRALAELVGPESVAAVDPSEPFVDACRERVPGADVRLAAAEKLPFPDDQFDAVLALRCRGRSAPRSTRRRQAALREACFRHLGSPNDGFTPTARAWFARGST
jgi:ubiquinone/menaquinone biosynthesis C-methylase UbiE